MIKKILAVLTLLVTLAAAISCGARVSGMTAEEAYQAARDALGAADEYEIITERLVTSTDGAETVSSERSTYRKHGDSIYMQNANLSNPKQNMEGWYVGGISYASFATMKVKMAVEPEKYFSENPERASDFLPDLDGDVLDGKKFEKCDGGYLVTLELSRNQYEALFGTLGIGGEIDGEVTFKMFFDADANVTATETVFFMKVSGVRLYSVSRASIAFDSEPISAPENEDDFELIE